MHAAGSGLNVLVVANSASSNSLDLANYYCQKRQVPPLNLLRVRWTGSPISWTPAQFNNTLLQPILQTLNTRGLSSQIEFVVLSMDFPYRIATTADQNGTTSALFYGFKTNDPASAGQICQFAPDGISGYYGSETLFREGGPANHPGHSFLATFLTANTLGEAKLIVDRAVLGDGTFPTSRIVLAKTSDAARNVRFRYFDNTVLDSRLLGLRPFEHVLLDDFSNLRDLGGLQTGLARFDAFPGTFSPGSLADSLTSYAGQLFETSGQTTLLECLNAGASGSYGTVAEPCNYLEKFPDPLAFIYQMRGFSLAESYYQSLLAPYQGIIVGDPLSAPFRRQATAAWANLQDLPVFRGATNLALTFTASDPDHPLHKIDLFLDGQFLQTITNIPPRPGNFLQLDVAGHSVTYAVPPDATLRSVTTNVGNLLTDPSFKDLTQVDAWSYGDRLEFQSLPEDRAGDDTPLAVRTEPGDAADLTVFARTARPTFLESTARGWREFQLKGAISSGDVLTLTITKTNSTEVAVSITNSPPASSLATFVQALIQRLNTAPALSASDGVFASDLAWADVDAISFNLFARGTGRNTSRIQAVWTLPAGLEASPSNSERLLERPNDLNPRNHVYITCGATNLTLAFPFDTSSLADGFHDLRAVAYEGTAIATQTHLPLRFRIQNTSFNATLERLGTGSTFDARTQAQVRVTSSFPASRIDLFTSGGVMASSTNQSTSTFTLDGNTLGAGRHAVFALVTATDGRQYRTDSLELTFYRHPPLTLTWSVTPTPELSWPAEHGFHYAVFSANSPEAPFVFRQSFDANVTGTLRWQDPDQEGPNPPAQRFYRVQASP